MDRGLKDQVFKTNTPAKSFVVLTALFALLIACTSKPYDPSTTITLVGTWKQTSELISDCGDPVQNAMEGACTNCLTLIINSSSSGYTWSSTGGAGGPSGGAWRSAGYYTVPTGFVSFDTNGIGSVLSAFSQTPTNLTLITETSQPGPGCKLTQKFTRQK